MKISRFAIAALGALCLTASVSRAQTTALGSPIPAAPEIPSPGEIVSAAPAGDWTAIAASDLLVMDLAPDAKGKPRRVVIQLMPAPFSQGWIRNIRKLAAAKFWDGTSVNRVQDNYVTQWGDATEKKALPEGLETGKEEDYVLPFEKGLFDTIWNLHGRVKVPQFAFRRPSAGDRELPPSFADTYSLDMAFLRGFPVGVDSDISDHISEKRQILTPSSFWPIHCYGMVGVGRNLSPDTGTGAELYTVIGHAPRHLDRNIALVGRIIEGMEHMSSLPRGTGALGFYETPEERTVILSVRLGGQVTGLPAYEYLNTESLSFAKYADARANRRDPFFITPAGGADICNIPVPVRRKK
jgi:cyclophilin family peptidyl-prolyl cis-trans isomerase